MVPKLRPTRTMLQSAPPAAPDIRKDRPPLRIEETPIDGGNGNSCCPPMVDCESVQFETENKIPQKTAPPEHLNLPRTKKRAPSRGITIQSFCAGKAGRAMQTSRASLASGKEVPATPPLTTASLLVK